MREEETLYRGQHYFTGSDFMSRKFTADEQAELRKNPYVKSIFDSKLCLTAKFKEAFWGRYQSGEVPAEILRSMGFDPKMLGTRTWTIVQSIKKELARNGTFSDTRSVGAAKEAANKNDEWVRHELAYLRQEVEFIKKTILLEREARRKCSSKKKAEPSSD
jgi:hypothetical protein